MKNNNTVTAIKCVVGKICKHVTIDEANAYIFGYTIGNDVTMENIFIKAMEQIRYGY